MPNDDRQQIIGDFNESVNMTRRKLEEWLQTEESRSVGQSDGGGESTGHRSGRRIVEILEKNRSDYNDDLAHMKKVTGYVRRHQAQKPERSVDNSNCRYSLVDFSDATHI